MSIIVYMEKPCCIPGLPILAYFLKYRRHLHGRDHLVKKPLVSSPKLGLRMCPGTAVQIPTGFFKCGINVLEDDLPTLGQLVVIGILLIA